MLSKPITLRPNGSLTLPKKMRDKHKTIHYMAVEVPEGVLLKPIDDIEYYEHKDGSFGLRFPQGIEAGKLAKMMRKAMKQLDEEEKSARQKKPRTSRRSRG